MTAKNTAKKLEIDWFETNWKEELKLNITTVPELESYLSLSDDERKDLEEVADRHPMNIPRYYMELINPNDPEDPVRKLAVPTPPTLNASTPVCAHACPAWSAARVIWRAQ